MDRYQSILPQLIESTRPLKGTDVEEFCPDIIRYRNSFFAIVVRGLIETDLHQPSFYDCLRELRSNKRIQLAFSLTPFPVELCCFCWRVFIHDREYQYDVTILTDSDGWFFAHVDIFSGYIGERVLSFFCSLSDFENLSLQARDFIQSDFSRKSILFTANRAFDCFARERMSRDFSDLLHTPESNPDEKKAWISWISKGLQYSGLLEPYPIDQHGAYKGLTKSEKIGNIIHFIKSNQGGVDLSSRSYFVVDFVSESEYYYDQFSSIVFGSRELVSRKEDSDASPGRPRTREPKHPDKPTNAEVNRPLKQVKLRLPEELAKAVTDQARAEGIDRNQWISRALRKQLDLK